MTDSNNILEAARKVDVSGVSIGDKAILLALLGLAEELVGESSAKGKTLTFKYTGEGDFYGWGFYDQDGNEVDVPSDSTFYLRGK